MERIEDGELRFLESAENVRRVVSETQDRAASAEIGRSVSVSVQQGRMFFQSASTAALEIRPLLLYYGMLAFARAVVCCRTLRSIATLSQSHGLKDTSPHSARLDALCVRVEERGTFHEFNDVVREQEGIKYFEHAMTRWHAMPTESSDQMAGTTISLKQCLSHTPRLEKLYHATFQEDPELLSFSLYSHSTPTDECQLRVDLPELFTDRESLQQIVTRIRLKYPLLTRWQLSAAEKAWDNSILIFRNAAPIADEFSEGNCRMSDDGRNVSLYDRASFVPVDFRELMDPICGDLSQSSPCLTTKSNGSYISDVSFQYVAMFLLSSLVRYRPQIWVHSVSRFATAERSADDQSLALIERFMDGVQASFPKLVVRLIAHRREP